MRSRVLLAVTVIILCALLTEGAVAQALQSGPAPGELIAIGDHKLHLRCVGPPAARPIVVLEAGGGAFSRDWTRVQDLLASRVRTCAYDRAGLGWSEPGPAPRTMRQEVFELHALLEAAKIPPPFVLVGQSIGGILVRLFTEQFGSDVLGVVLVDPAHESAVLGSVRYGGMVRLREKATGRSVPEPRLAGKASTHYNPDDDYLAEEFQQIYLARKANPVPFGSRPLIVLAAGKRPAPPGMSEDLWTQLRLERDGQLIDLSRLSSNSKFVLDPSSSHTIHIDNAPLVARSIEEVLAALSKRVPLAP